ncbi:MAG: hypothetical protein SGI99_09260 [Pseudomonadota bacterium]|nr:hypothetical protein [Pseudomonadota bacterium]
MTDADCFVCSPPQPADAAQWAVRFEAMPRREGKGLAKGIPLKGIEGLRRDGNDGDWHEGCRRLVPEDAWILNRHRFGIRPLLHKKLELCAGRIRPRIPVLA